MRKERKKGNSKTSVDHSVNQTKHKQELLRTGHGLGGHAHTNTLLSSSYNLSPNVLLGNYEYSLPSLRTLLRLEPTKLHSELGSKGLFLTTISIKTVGIEYERRDHLLSSENVYNVGHP